MKYKLSGDSVNLHGRISTILSFLIILGVGSSIFFGITEVERTLTSTKTAPPKKQTPIPTTTEEQSIFDIPINETPEPTSLTSPTSLPTQYDDLYEPTPTPPTPKPKTASAIRYYIQVFALTKKDKALQQCSKESNQGNTTCVLGVIEADTAPYKLLLGPFHDQLSAKTHLHRSGRKGFVRSSTQIDYFLSQ